LTGHKNEGYGLSWSHQREGYLLSGSDDAQICVWDVKGTTQSNRVSQRQQPLELFTES
jgi:histone-binding protein RBBP4